MQSLKYSHMSAFLSARLHTHARVCGCVCVCTCVVNACQQCICIKFSKNRLKRTPPESVQQAQQAAPNKQWKPFGLCPRQSSSFCGRRTQNAAYFVAQAEILFCIGETKFSAQRIYNVVLLLLLQSVLSKCCHK